MNEVFLVKLEADEPDHLKAAPFGILYLASALQQAGMKVRLYHETGTRANVERIVADVIEKRPLLVGFSALTGRSLAPALSASRTVKRESPVPVVWGGLHPTMLPEQTLAEEAVDIVVIGEGEETVVELAEVISQRGLGQKSLAQVAGIAFKVNDGVHVTPARPYISNLDCYRPEWSLLGIEKYIFKGRYFHSDGGSRLKDGRIASIVTSRGCPWRCSYCYNASVNKRTFRAHSVERVVSDIAQLRESQGITALAVLDDNFFTNKRRALAIAESIGVPWSSSARASDIARWGEDFVATIRRHGCVELQVGIESGSPRVLETLQKDITVDDVLRSAELCRVHDIRMLCSFMIGIPNETPYDMRLTFDLMDFLRTKGENIAVNGPGVYFPWPGTPLHDQAAQFGFKTPEKIDEWAIIPFGTRRPKVPFARIDVRVVEHYRRLAWRTDWDDVSFPILVRALSALSRWRWKRRFFRLPVDYFVPRLLLDILRALGLRRTVDAIYSN